MLDTARTPPVHSPAARYLGKWRKIVRAQSKKEKSITTGVKNRHFGVKNEKTDSQMLSKQMKKLLWRKFIDDWC